MNKDDYQIRIDLLTEAAADRQLDLVNAINSAGVACRVVAMSSASNPDSQGQADAVLVDWRDTSRSLPTLPKNIPAIALVNAEDKSLINAASSFVFDDFVSVAELACPLFLHRLKRVLGRYRSPIALSRLKRPELQLIQAIVDNSSDWIFVKDLYHRFLFVSEAFARTARLTRDEIIGRDDLEIGTNVVDVYGSPELGWRGFWEQDDEVIASGEPTLELLNPGWSTLVGQSDRQRCLRYPLKNRRGEVYALLVITTNIAKPADNRLDINARSNMLDKVLGEMHMAQENRLVAEKSAMAKNKLLASASHDLRQPLHAMGLFLDLLERRVTGDEQLELISSIKRSSNTLSALFSSLLDISRLDADIVKVSRTHFPLENLLSNLRGEFEALGLQKSLTVSIPHCDDVIYTDAVLFERILRNLVQNAVTYTKAGTVFVGYDYRKGALDVVVSDTGPGIPAKEQEKIYTEYYQIQRPEQVTTKGLGLGLAIVYRLIDLLDLDLHLHSEIGEGTRFCISVPLGECALVALPIVENEQPKLAGQTILIIDDETDIRSGMASILRGYECSTITAESADKAIEMLTRQGVTPDVIVADYRLLDGETGDRAVAQLRQLFNTDLPAVIVTGDTSTRCIREITQCGFQILHKPVKPEKLVAAISNLLAAGTEYTPAPTVDGSLSAHGG
jgi:signal transduction histidine kinase/ActR/RegA family two-component response regulator